MYMVYTHFVFRLIPFGQQICKYVPFCLKVKLAVITVQHSAVLAITFVHHAVFNSLTNQLHVILVCKPFLHMIPTYVEV